MDKKEFYKRIRKVLYITFSIVLLLSIFVILGFHGIGIPCLFHEITGLQCPGCGNSRAALALLKLDFKSAFHYNLLFPLEFFYIAFVYVKACLHYIRHGRFSYKSPCIYMDYTFLGVVFLWGILRNFLHL